MDHDESLELEGIIAPALSDGGFEVFDILINHNHGTANIELLVDHPNGGIQMNECADLNRHIVAVIDQDGRYGDDYTLSVCSPGLDRPLKSRKDFQRVLGSQVQVTHQDPHDAGSLSDQGMLMKVDEHSILVISKKRGEVKILLEHIQHAGVII